MKLFITLIVLISVSAYSADPEIEELKKRIEELEKQQEHLLLSSGEPRPTVQSFLKNNLTLGGFFDGGYNFVSGPDTDTQWVNESNVIGLNIASDFTSDLRFLGQLVNLLYIPMENIHNNPDAEAFGMPSERKYRNYGTLAFVSQGYLEYKIDRAFNVQGGLGFVPFGYASQLREPVLYVRRAGPQLVRNSTLVAPFWSGIHLYGSKGLGRDKHAGYNVYTFTPPSHVDFIGVGARAWLARDDENITVGASTQLSKNEDETYEVLGFDIRLDVFPFQIRSEFTQVFLENEDNWSLYFEPGYYIHNEDVLLYVFGDYVYGANNEITSGNSRLPDPIQKWEYGAGVNILPTSYTRIRFGFTFHDYVGHRSKLKGQSRDYFAVDTSFGVAF